MSIYKPMDSKREEFRKYLERTGVMDALTKALVALYEEANKPEDALTYVRGHLGGAAIDQQMRALQRENKELRLKLEKYETVGVDSAPAAGATGAATAAIAAVIPPVQPAESPGSEEAKAAAGEVAGEAVAEAAGEPAGEPAGESAGEPAGDPAEGAGGEAPPPEA